MGVLLPILMYHQVAPESDPGFEPYLHVTPDALRQQIEAITEQGFRFVSLSDAWAQVQAGTHERCACITFDDLEPGFEQNALPILQGCGVPATGFVIANQIIDSGVTPSNTPGISVEGLTALQAGGVEIGSHSVSHREMHRLSNDELRSEIVESRARIEEALGCACPTFCYPRGRVTSRVACTVADAGYTCATSTLRGTIQSPDCRYQLRRIRMHSARLGWRLRAALSWPYDLCNAWRRVRESHKWAHEEAVSLASAEG